MKQTTGLVILMGASALAAAQSPPSSTGTDSSHATAPAATSATSTTPSATSSSTSSASTTTSSNVAVTPQSSSSSSTDKKDFKIPKGYKRVVRNGEERFCRNDPVPNSRVQKQEVCLTQTELEAEQRGTQDFIQNVQRNSGTAMYSSPNGAGGR